MADKPGINPDWAGIMKAQDKPAWKPYVFHKGPWPKIENPPTDPEAERRAQAKTIKMVLRSLWEACGELGISWSDLTYELESQTDARYLGLPPLPTQ